MEKLFKLKEHGTDVKTEIIAGITTFLAMAYILAVNPSYLGGIDGMSAGAVFSATAISAGIATLCMAFFANCCSCVRYGTKCILCIYSMRCYGLQLQSCIDRSIY